MGRGGKSGWNNAYKKWQVNKQGCFANRAHVETLD